VAGCAGQLVQRRSDQNPQDSQRRDNRYEFGESAHKCPLCVMQLAAKAFFDLAKWAAPMRLFGHPVQNQAGG
jgi:hypothetical protein